MAFESRRAAFSRPARIGSLTAASRSPYSPNREQEHVRTSQMTSYPGRSRDGDLAGAARQARFSELLDACVREGPQVVSRRGAETAVLVPIEEWRRLEAAARPSLKELLLAPSARSETLVPPRGKARRRELISL